MTTRREQLEGLTARLRDHEAVADAFLAKSFTDRLVIVDVCDGESVPEALGDLLVDRDLRPAEAVYGGDEERSFVGAVGDATRHHFVDVRTRGSHHSYVVD